MKCALRIKYVVAFLFKSCGIGHDCVVSCIVVGVIKTFKLVITNTQVQITKQLFLKDTDDAETDYYT